MLRPARTFLRGARDRKLLGSVAGAIDRAWWARAIRRGSIVDLEFVRAQTGSTVSYREAIRHYVRGGFTSGLALNVLFADDLVSSQLPDADRVPALYAYLVNDPRKIETSAAWDAPAYAAANPASLAAPGGPVGHAWRQARETNEFALVSGTRRVVTTWQALSALAVESAGIVRGHSEFTTGPVPGSSRNIFWAIGRDEADATESMRLAAQITSSLDAAVHLILESPSTTVLVGARLLAAADSAVSVHASFNLTAAELVGQLSALVTTGVVAVKGPSAVVDLVTVDRLLQHATDRRVAPLWLSPRGTVVSAGAFAHEGRRVSLLADHPVEDARRLGDWLDVPEIEGGTYAEPANAEQRTGADRTILTATAIAPTTHEQSRAPKSSGDIGNTLSKLDLDVVAWTDSTPYLRRRRSFATLPDSSRVPRLRWAVRTSAPAGPSGESWGDTHYARGIADALRRVEQEAVVDSFEARNRHTSYLDDITLTLRGPRRIDPPAHGRSILWVISHPQEVDQEEIDAYDIVFAASESWAERASVKFHRKVIPLLQCTDVFRFRPRGIARTDDVVFVGTARGIARPSVVRPIEAGFPVKVYGPDWRGFIPASNISATSIPNADLPARYESAAITLNDHWPSMKREGFISNRPYDVVAAGGRVISDDVENLTAEFEGAVRTYSSVDELLELLAVPPAELFPPESELSRISGMIRRRDSFDARVKQILAAALA